MIKYFIGPMSKNVVDSVIELDNPIVGFIPSRRQVDYDGGYVNNWTTKQFSEYVNNRVVIQRDHGGESQGNKQDDGLTSFLFDKLIPPIKPNVLPFVTIFIQFFLYNSFNPLKH